MDQYSHHGLLSLELEEPTRDSFALGIQTAITILPILDRGKPSFIQEARKPALGGRRGFFRIPTECGIKAEASIQIHSCFGTTVVLERSLLPQHGF